MHRSLSFAAFAAAVLSPITIRADVFPITSVYGYS
jgi:hypothetical protein